MLVFVFVFVDGRPLLQPSVTLANQMSEAQLTTHEHEHEHEHVHVHVFS